MGFRCWTKGFLVFKWGVFGVELRSFWCGTEGFGREPRGVLNWKIFDAEVRGLVWNRGVFGVELRVFFAKLRDVFNWEVFGVELRGVLNWGIFDVELRGFGVELRGVLNWEVFGVELRNFGGWKGVALLCVTDVLNWGGCETEKTLILYNVY